jgi:glycosyltransferase involved in cell wall biosynthesis
MEAMACRLPVILSDIPPHREIAEGVDFIPLIPPEDVAGFAREIKKFREMSISERTVIGEKCRSIIEERFSLYAMHAGLAEVYAQITGNQVATLIEELR